MKTDDCDADKLALSGSNHDALLRLDAVIRLSGLARGNVENVILLVVLDIELVRSQYYALHTTSPFIFFRSEVK